MHLILINTTFMINTCSLTWVLQKSLCYVSNSNCGLGYFSFYTNTFNWTVNNLSDGDCLLVTVNTYVFSRPDSSSHYHVNTLTPCRQKADCAQLLDGDPIYQNGHPWYRIKYNGAVRIMQMYG